MVMQAASEREGAEATGPRAPARPSQNGWPHRLRAALPYAVVLVAAAAMYAVADRMEFDRVEGRAGPDLWPKLILAGMAAAALWGTLRELAFPAGAGALPAGDMAEEFAAADREIYPGRVWAVLVATAIYILALPVLGFFTGTLAFLLFVFVCGGYRRWGRALGLALLCTLVLMVVFVRLVYVSLPLGVQPFATVSVRLVSILNP